MRSVLIVVLALAGIVACTEEDPSANYARGRGLKPAELSVQARAQIYRAALEAAFDLGPELELRLHPRLLPRERGLAGGRDVPEQLARELRARGTIQGICEPTDTSKVRAPHCDADRAGYVVRFSDVLGAGGDSVQVYLNAERYGTVKGPPGAMLQFEKAYQLVPKSGVYKVVREGRVPQTVSNP